MFILIGALVYLALIGVAYFFYYRLTKTKGQLFGTLQELQRAKARLAKASDQARIAEEGWKTAIGHLESSLGNTDEALQVAKEIKGVGQMVSNLSEYIMYPFDEAPGRHAMPDNAMVAPEVQS